MQRVCLSVLVLYRHYLYCYCVYFMQFMVGNCGGTSDNHMFILIGNGSRFQVRVQMNVQYNREAQAEVIYFKMHKHTHTHTQLHQHQHQRITDANIFIPKDRRNGSFVCNFFVIWACICCWGLKLNNTANNNNIMNGCVPSTSTSKEQQRADHSATCAHTRTYINSPMKIQQLTIQNANISNVFISHTT